MTLPCENKLLWGENSVEVGVLLIVLRVGCLRASKGQLGAAITFDWTAGTANPDFEQVRDPLLSQACTFGKSHCIMRTEPSRKRKAGNASLPGADSEPIDLETLSRQQHTANPENQPLTSENDCVIIEEARPLELREQTGHELNSPSGEQVSLSGRQNKLKEGQSKVIISPQNVEINPVLCLCDNLCLRQWAIKNQQNILILPYVTTHFMPCRKLLTWLKQAVMWLKEALR